MKDFGVVVVCSKNDYLFTKGCCASIRHFMGDVPICLLVDGDMSVEGLSKTYNTKVLNRKDVKNDFLRENSYGWGITKMIAFWESPFDNFLLIDSDICLWGDMSKHADFEHYDLIIDKPVMKYSEKDVCDYFFETSVMKNYDPAFQWKETPFVCTGIFFSKRNVFDLNEYREMLEYTKKNPNVFKCGEMGFVNYWMFKKMREGKLKVAQKEFQYLVVDHPKENAESTFPMKVLNEGLPVSHPMVIHWAGSAKPVMDSEKYYVEPMTYFRKKYIHDKYGFGDSLAMTMLKAEDLMRKQRLRVKHYLSRIKS